MFLKTISKFATISFAGRDRAQGEDGCRVEPDSAGITGITTGPQPTTYQGTREGEAIIPGVDKS